MLGDLSAIYESSRKGSKAIGWDQGGQLSVGKYQIAFATGTLRRFLDFCKVRYPFIFERLDPLYGSITAGPESKRCGFATEWVKLAEAEILGDSEHKFIKATHFDPVFRRLPESIKIMVATSMTLQQILWSMSVQHRGSTVQKLFKRAYKEDISNEQLIKNLYEVRRVYVRQITKLRQSTRAALVQRYNHEEHQALMMLKDEIG